MIRLARAIVSGEVQGVGYRYRILHISRGFAVSGFVRNRDDGSVEIQAEGEEDEVMRFLEACRIKDGYTRVEEMKVEWRPAENKFTGFTILR